MNFARGSYPVCNESVIQPSTEYKPLRKFLIVATSVAAFLFGFVYSAAINAQDYDGIMICAREGGVHICTPD